MGKVNNALKMLAILKSRGKVSRKELAQELEVGIREISRYKDDLESAGVNITNIKGKYGGYVLEHKDYLLNLELSKAEQDSLENAATYLKHKNFPYYSVFVQALNKIRSVNPNKNPTNKILNINDKSAKAKIEYKKESKIWLKINDSIISNRKLKIKYSNATGQITERIICPYALFTYYEANYVIAYCEVKKEIRQFKFMRIEEIELLEEKFKNEEINIDEYLKNTMGLFKDELINMKLKIRYPYAKGFTEVRWINNEKITDFIEDGYIIYEANAYGKKQIINWIMGMGEFCEVIEPKSLRRDVIKNYEKILREIYNGTI